MQDFFNSLDFCHIIQDGFEEPPEETGSLAWIASKQAKYKDDKKRDCTALHYIKQQVGKMIYPCILNEKEDE